MDIVHVNEYRIFHNIVVIVKELHVFSNTVRVFYCHPSNFELSIYITYTGYIRHLNDHFKPIPKQKRRNHLPKWMK